MELSLNRSAVVEAGFKHPSVDLGGGRQSPEHAGPSTKHGRYRQRLLRNCLHFRRQDKQAEKDGHLANIAYGEWSPF